MLKLSISINLNLDLFDIYILVTQFLSVSKLYTKKHHLINTYIHLSKLYSFRIVIYIIPIQMVFDLIIKQLYGP